jgi:hypothetical protein
VPRAASREANELLADLREERRAIEALLREVRRVRDEDIEARLREELDKALDAAKGDFADALAERYERAAQNAFNDWLEEKGPGFMADRFDALPDTGLRLPPPARVKPIKVKGAPTSPVVVPLAADYRPPYGPCTVVYRDGERVVSERSARHLTDGSIREERKRGLKPDHGRYDLTVRFSDGVQKAAHWVGRDGERLFCVCDEHFGLYPTERTLQAIGGGTALVGKVVVEYVQNGEVVATRAGVHHGDGNITVVALDPPPEHDVVRVRYANGEMHDVHHHTSEVIEI